MEKEKEFIVFNTAFIGDMLVTNSLVKNIKYYYPNSKVIFVCNKPFLEVAKYQEGVDDVISFDKKKDKTLLGILNFAKNFPYKKPYASFVTYSNERNLLISHLIGAKHIISHHNFSLWNTKEKFPIKEYTHMNDRWGGMIEPLVGEYQILPISYRPPFIKNDLIKKIENLAEYKKLVVLCTTRKMKAKDMPIEDCLELINILNKNGYTPILTGAGNVSREYSTSLRKLGCFNFIDLVDCTNFVDLANILKISKRCISVDTGTMHFANALNVPLVDIFYHDCAEMWAPKQELYPVKTILGRPTPEKIFKTLLELTGEKDENYSKI